MKRSLLIIGMIISSLSICGCATHNSNMVNDILPTDEYVAVYEESTNISTLIGNTTYTPASPMPVPMPKIPFDYNNSTGNVVSWTFGPHVVNDSFRILFGKMSYFSDPVAYGYEGTFSSFVYQLPFTVDDGFTITRITRNGTIYATYYNESLRLNPGDTWTSPTTTGTYMGRYYTKEANSTYINLTYYSWPATYNTSFTITNYGIYEKSLLNTSYGAYIISHY